MNQPTKKVRKYLNELVKNSELKRLKKEDMLSFKEKLEECLSGAGGELIEYEKEQLFLGMMSKWMVSERSPLVGLRVESHKSDLVYFESSSANQNRNGIKYFRPDCSDIAFLSNCGLYESISLPERPPIYEYIYLPKKIIEQII